MLYFDRLRYSTYGQQLKADSDDGSQASLAGVNSTRLDNQPT